MPAQQPEPDLDADGLPHLDPLVASAFYAYLDLADAERDPDLPIVPAYDAHELAVGALDDAQRAHYDSLVATERRFYAAARHRHPDQHRALEAAPAE